MPQISSQKLLKTCFVKAIMLGALIGMPWVNTAIAQQPTYIKASNAEASDNFAQSISISGSTLIVGAVREDSNSRRVNGDETDNSRFDAGAAYAFVRSPAGVWTQQAYLKIATATGSSNNLGHAVAISGDTAVVSSPWSSIVGSPGPGAAFVFQRNGTDWCGEIEVAGELVCRQDSLLSSNFEIGDSYGSSTAISGDTIVVGAPLEDSNATGVNGNGSDNSMQWSGAAYVFVHDGNSWIQQAYLKASNTGPNDRFGTSVAISGDIIVVSAVLESSNLTGVDNPAADNDLATEAGAAYVFVRNAGIWTQQAYLKASNTDASDWFGQSVAVSDNTVVVGARGEDSNATGVNGDGSNNDALSSGAAYVFTRNDLGVWSQHNYLKASNTGANDQLGSTVAISGNMLAVGAQFEDDVVTDSGAAYVFGRDGGGDWSQLNQLKASNPGLADRFSGSLSVSNDQVVAGTWYEDSNATGINGDQNNNLASDSGAAYAYTVDGTDLPPLVLAFSLIPNVPITQGAILELEALASDVNRGDQNIISADYQIDGGNWIPMTAFDGAFDSSLEQIQGFADTTALAIEMHTACVRATQLGGLKSASVCLDFEVVPAAEPDNFMVVCMHDPLWPKAGETVQISMKVLALPADDSDTPTSVQNLEIWFEDATEPKWQNESGPAWSLYATTPKLLSGSFNYGCRARQGDKSVFTGWRTVTVGSLPADKPVPVIYSGASSDRVDIVFIADADSYTGSGSPLFLEHIRLLIRRSFYEYGLYNRYQHLFNFWLSRNTGTADTGCVRTRPVDWVENYSFSNAGAIIHTDNFRDCAGTTTFSAKNDDFRVVRHEAGHRPYGLADEYCCDGGNFESEIFPNVYETLHSCENDAPELGRAPEACRSWVSSRNDETYYTSEPAGDDLMRNARQPNAADIRRIEWMFQKCIDGEC